MNRRKLQVVNHALALFNEKGVIQTSIQDIIERAGISKGTFYNYFSSKNECVCAVLEKVRYETGISRSELQIGQKPNDIEILIQQISLLSHANQKYGLSAMFDEILHSQDMEMKQYVTQYRIHEIEWLADRLVDVYGERVRAHAFEAAVIFYGIQRHLLFAAKSINQTHVEPGFVSRSVFRYLSRIMDCLLEEGTAVLNADKLNALKSRMTEEKIKLSAIFKGFDENAENCRFTKSQADLTEALRNEMERQPLREAVVNALLQPYLDAFKGSSNYAQAKDIVTMIWRFINQ